jgi:hypothetical protein
MILPANRFPSGPAYDEGREPQYICSRKLCGYLAWTPDELHACIVCKWAFCADHLREIGGEKYCEDCANCACGQPALISCDECGTLVCDRHMLIHPVLNLCNKCSETARVA